LEEYREAIEKKKEETSQKRISLHIVSFFIYLKKVFLDEIRKS